MNQYIDYIIALLAAIIFTSWHAILTSLVISNYDEVELHFSYVFGVEWLAFLPLGLAMLLVMWAGRIRPQLFLNLSKEVVIRHALFAIVVFLIHSVWQQYINSVFLRSEFTYASIERDFMGFLEMRYLAYIIMIGLVGGMIKLREHGKISLKESDLKLELQRARLRELELRMNPEIIYPTIDYIKKYANRSPEKASQMVILLAGLLRRLVDNLEGDLVLISNDVQLFILYRDMLQLRKQKPIRFEKEIDEAALNKKIPPMILLIPFLEESFFGIHESFFETVDTIKYSVDYENDRISLVEVSFYPLSNTTELEHNLRRNNFLDKINKVLDSATNSEYVLSSKVDTDLLRLRLSEPENIDK
ncbi:MAG: hypothetical protein BalsKO_00860 [Balneolaceae bacterium]